MTYPSPARRTIPLSIKLAVALRALGVKASDINWSHEPALGLRAINEDGTDYDPPQHDPEYIFIRTKVQHSHITNKNNGTGRSDKGAIAHVRHLTEAQEETRRRILARNEGEPKPKSRWAKRKFQKQRVRP